MHILSIGGSDPSSGAGIQADIKTFSSLGTHGLCVVTAITSQNTKKFSRVETVSNGIIKSQLESVLSDFKINMIKIGMLYSSGIIRTIYFMLKKTKIPIVLDPVFESTTGGTLLQKEAFSDFKKFLVPLSYIITPNVPEAEKLSGLKIKNEQDVRRAAKKIQSLGAKNVIIKGGHLRGDLSRDFVLEGSKFYSFSAKKIPITIRGTGCTFSASLTVALVKGKTLKDAVGFAKEFTTESIKNSQKIGKGIPIVNIDTKDIIERELSDAISSFTKIKNIYKVIPEVQTNFVFSKPKPRSTNDILGVSGRIVKASKSIIPAGNLEYGGSRHVGSALLEVSSKFPATRSAMNIKFDKKFIKKAKAKKLLVKSYQRTDEPFKTKSKEGRTISWGIRGIIRDAKKAPDLIFHTGDIGKEPMIIIFGKNTKDVLDKLAKII
ncbi:MAG TPA: bifunctional hydroxymethylpyrimidine kinase/phosphomethylpyrimidine kinase [Nitrosopumilaceae archaeon]|nr:bifunctional hydroxymethylpyrimidine kinase/phosphomethylpyrimidine kinase [Nitrosopumilaceae archaeon]